MPRTARIDIPGLLHHVIVRGIERRDIFYGEDDKALFTERLAKLLVNRPAKVNLIPFNPFPGSNYRRSSLEVLNGFRQVLLDAGIMTITRRTRGDDIAAACGQLAGQVSNRVRVPLSDKLHEIRWQN